MTRLLGNAMVARAHVARLVREHANHPGRKFGPAPKPPVDYWAVQPKDAVTRAHDYHLQTDRNALTPKQARRLEKKCRRAAKLRHIATTGEHL
jgi:hypothetical protein